MLFCRRLCWCVHHCNLVQATFPSWKHFSCSFLVGLIFLKWLPCWQLTNSTPIHGHESPVDEHIVPESSSFQLFGKTSAEIHPPYPLILTSFCLIAHSSLNKKFAEMKGGSLPFWALRYMYLKIASMETSRESGATCVSHSVIVWFQW